MKILITGGTGFVGSNLVNKLKEFGHQVYATGFCNENNIANVIGHDLSELEEKHLKNYDVCFHQAANNDTLETDKEKIFEENVHGPKILFEKLYKYGCRKFIYASSTAVYGNRKSPFSEDSEPLPLNVYAESKLSFDNFAMQFAREKNASVVGLRYCNIYGSNEQHKGRRASMIFQIYKSLVNKQKPKIFKNGDQKRDWCYVKDVVNANIKCLYYEKSNIFNIANGKSVSFNYLFEVLKENLKSNLEIEYIDCNFKEKYQNDTECDISKAEKELGWMPYFNIENGIKDYICSLSSIS